MARKYVRIGSMSNIHIFDDGDFDGALETDDTIKAHQAPVANEDVLRLEDVGDIAGDVIGPGAATDHAVVRWDGASGTLVEDSAVIVTDAGHATIPGGATLGVAANKTEFSATGILTFVGIGGFLTGCCYGDHIAWVQAGAVQNTWYNIVDADMVDGLLRGVTHDGNGKLTVTEPGIWLVLYSITLEASQANEHLECGIEINNSGSAEPMGITHIESKFASQEEGLTGFAVLDLADNSTIEVCVRTTDPAPAPNITVDDLHLTAILIGGT